MVEISSMKKVANKKKSSSNATKKNVASSHDIIFYRADEKPYGAFSNLYRREITFEGQVFATSEHAYQAGKARKKSVRDWILNAPTPGLVAMAAHGLYTWDIVPNWAKIKFDRMRNVLRVKFTQHEDLRMLLLSTNDNRLVEAGRVDNAVNRVWGEVNGKGQNMLGVLLMEIRTELRNATSRAASPRTRKKMETQARSKPRRRVS
jgi:ribA/ribD-fused uncharacterized protein